MDDDDDADGDGTTKTTQWSASNCIERCPDGKADGGERSSSNIVDDVGYKNDNKHAVSPRSGRQNGDSGDTVDNNEDDKGIKR